MNITVHLIGIHHDLILTVLAAHPQFDLGVVTGNNEVTFRCFNKVSYANRIIRLTGHVLEIRVIAAKTPGIRRQCIKVRMDAPGRGINIFPIPCNIGAGDLVPLPVFLHQLKQMRELRLMDIAPLFQLDHYCIIGRFLIGCSHPHDRQAQRTKQTILKIIRGAVGANVDIRADNRRNLFSDPGHLLFCFLLPFGHIACIDRNTIVFHDPQVYRRRGLNVLDNPPVFRKVPVKPPVHNMVETQRKVCVGTGVPDRLRIGRIQLIKVPALCHSRERRQWFLAEIQGQCLKP